ncbi:unnamed protein product [Leptidea sinapis]|uniref:DUF4781 domain-containing protein n=1 Tax=Leptidea sinapis TaxID=189913 RepID=A0A5E4QW43_9NEOP|nr:unnamed protein product [Leptidea sinapis]
MTSNTNQDSTSTDQLVDDKLINLTPVEIQQEYFENLDGCDWVKYELCNRGHLIKNLAFALFGAPSEIEDLLIISNDEEENNLAGYTSRQKEQVVKVYEQIYDQRKYSKNNEDIVMSVLLIVCVRPKPLPFYKLSPSDYWVDLHKKNDVDIWCTAVFRGTEEFVVKLTVSPSASLGLSAVVLGSADTVSTMASVGALGVIGASAFTPVGPILLGGAAVATVGSAVYGIVRSSMHLHDRRIHKQGISPLKAEARGSWLNIAGSSIGLGAGAASSLLAKSAAAGTNLTTVGKALTASVEILRHANLLTGSMGVINSIVHFATNVRINAPNVPTKLTPPAAGNIYSAEEENKRGVNNIIVGIRPEEVLRIGLHLIRVSASGANSVASLLEDLSQEAHANVMTVVLNIISKLIPEEIAKLRLLSPDEDLITQVVKFMLYYLKNERPFGSPCAHNDNSLVVVLAEFFQDGLVKQETILKLKNRLLRWIDSELDRYRKCFPNKETIICEACNGLRYKY